MKATIVKSSKKLSAPVIGGSVSILLFWTLGPDVTGLIPAAPEYVVVAGTSGLTWLASLLIPDYMEA